MKYRYILLLIFVILISACSKESIHINEPVDEIISLKEDELIGLRVNLINGSVYDYTKEFLPSDFVVEGIYSSGRKKLEKINVENILQPQNLPKEGEVIISYLGKVAIVPIIFYEKIGDYNVYYDGNKAKILCYTGNDKEVVIPSEFGGKNTYSVEEGAFRSKKITSVTLPNTLFAIEQYAFGENEIVEVVIPKSLLKIGEGAFLDNKINTLVIPVENSLFSIEKNAFKNNNLSEVDNISKIVTVDNNAFDTNVIIKN